MKILLGFLISMGISGMLWAVEPGVSPETPADGSESIEMEEVGVQIEEIEPAPVLPPDARVMRGVLRGRELHLGDAELFELVEGTYAGADYALLWHTDDGVKVNAEALVEVLQESHLHGLQPKEYDLNRIVDKLYSSDESLLARAQLDAALTFALLDYADDVATGRVKPEAVNADWHIERESLAIGPLLEAVRSQDQTEFRETLNALPPSHPQYQLLQDALAQLRKRSSSVIYPTVPGRITKPIEQGDRYAHAHLLYERLIASGDLSVSVELPDPQLYSRDLAEGIESFQKRNASLEVDGILGEKTLAAINSDTPATQVQRIIANLDRWRWMPNDLGESHIIVNVPEFRMQGFRGGEQVLDLNVVVGTTFSGRNTPLFSNEMRYVIFQPYWNVPHGIARNELLPKGANYLLARGYQTVGKSGVYSINAWTMSEVRKGNLMLRQSGGSGNALGRVKFLFPNEYSVYFHDTPHKHLFERSKRAFSHGCIRVQHPEKLAAFSLHEHPEWTAEKIDSAMKGSRRRSITLESNIPVYIGYFTTTIGEGGEIRFHSDIYGYDERLLRAHVPNISVRPEVVTPREAPMTNLPQSR